MPFEEGSKMRGLLSLAVAALVGLGAGGAAKAEQRTYWSETDQAFVTFQVFDGKFYADSSAIPRQDIAYAGPHGPRTIVVNTSERRLYYVYAPGRAIKYGVGVGREGFTWSGTNVVTRKAEWPSWSPPDVMIARERAKGNVIPAFMPGGEDNPLGARALYIGNTIYRIHGTREPWTIGHAVSSGCIRLTNEDVVDLYDRVAVGTRVVVLN